jgi:hypothetical protein
MRQRHEVGSATREPRLRTLNGPLTILSGSSCVEIQQGTRHCQFCGLYCGIGDNSNKIYIENNQLHRIVAVAAARATAARQL